MLEILPQLYQFKGEEVHHASKAFGPALHENILITVKSDGIGWIKGGIRLTNYVRVSKIDRERLSTQSGYRRMPASLKRFWLWPVTKRAKWFYKSTELDIIVDKSTTLVQAFSFSLKEFKFERRTIALNPKGVMTQRVPVDFKVQTYMPKGNLEKWLIHDRQVPVSKPLLAKAHNPVMLEIRQPKYSKIGITNFSEFQPADRKIAHENLNLNPSHYEHLGLF